MDKRIQASCPAHFILSIGQNEKDYEEAHAVNNETVLTESSLPAQNLDFRCP
jgi:hypothetical protein